MRGSGGGGAERKRERERTGRRRLERRAEDRADAVEHVDLRRAREQRPERVHLGHYAAGREHVDRTRVVRRAQQHLRRAVPPARSRT